MPFSPADLPTPQSASQRWPTGLRAALLWPVEGLYRLLVTGRAAAYRWGWLATRRAAQPVVAVGNLTVGGSGKTPLVEVLLHMAQEAGLRPACLSRGHGRRGRSDLSRVCLAQSRAADAESVGDEVLMLAARHPRVPFYVGKDRGRSARLAALVDQPQVLVLDDAFQHLRLARDLNIVLVDAAAGLGNGRLLPRGPLREPLGALRRADVVLVSKANLGPAEAWRQALRERLGGVPVFLADYLPQRLTPLEGGAALDLARLAGRPVRLLCGIAEPVGFRRTLEALGAPVREMLAYPDHHPYPEADLRALRERLDRAAAFSRDMAGAEGAAGADQAPPEGGPDQAALAGDERAEPLQAEPCLWVTTEKDAVKLRGRLGAHPPLWVLEMQARLEPAAEAFFFDSLRRLAVK